MSDILLRSLIKEIRVITFETNLGNISIELDEEHTPKTAENFLNYAKEGFYDGTIFHRVIDGFMIQGGGFDVKMEQKEAGENIENEANLGGKNIRGALAMARTSDPHSASAQFFINVSDNNFLDHKAETMDGWGYCVFGNVVDGMDVVDKIKAVATTSKNGHQDVPTEEVIINKTIIE